METRANYLLIGVFTLAGLVGSLAFLLWLAKVEIDRQYAYYMILFDDVSGLSNAGDVRFNGLPVGQIVGLELDPDDPSRVRVRIEVAANTPVTVDTVAILQSQGVTGVAYVALSGGGATAAPLPQGSVIPAEASAFQSVLEGAPDLLQKAVGLLEDVNEVFDTQNRQAISEVLDNLASASGRLDSTLENFEVVSADVSQVARDVSSFSGRLTDLADTAETTLTSATVTLNSTNEAMSTATETLSTATETFSTATDTLTSVQTLIERGGTVLGSAEGTLRTVDQTFLSAQSLIDGDLTDFVRQGTASVATLETTLQGFQTLPAEIIQATEQVSGLAERLTGLADTAETTLTTATDTLNSTSGALDTATETFSTATDTLTRAQSLIARGDTVLDSAEGTLRTVDQTFGSAQVMIEGDLALFLRQGTASAETLDSTLKSIEPPARQALATAQTALTEAAETFAAANTILTEDVDGMITDMRGAVTAFTDTVENASGDIDAISGEVLAAATSISDMAATIQTIVSDNSRQVSNFLRSGLPEFVSLTEDARQLVVNLGRFIDRIERDPARFFLGTQGSDFRR